MSLVTKNIFGHHMETESSHLISIALPPSRMEPISSRIEP
jgi:hypothetical protein